MCSTYTSQLPEKLQSLMKVLSANVVRFPMVLQVTLSLLLIFLCCNCDVCLSASRAKYSLFAAYSSLNDNFLFDSREKKKSYRSVCKSKDLVCLVPKTKTWLLHWFISRFVLPKKKKKLFESMLARYVFFFKNWRI